MITVLFQNSRCLCSFKNSLLAEVSHDEAKMRERGGSLPFLSFSACERPLLAWKFTNSQCAFFSLMAYSFVLHQLVCIIVIIVIIITSIGQ